MKSEMIVPDRILVISQYDFPLERRNQNKYQRLYYGSRYAKICLLLPARRIVSDELSGIVEVKRAPFSGKVLFYLFSIYFAFVCRLGDYRLIFTDDSSISVVGFFAKYVLRYYWVMDLWDRPLWKPGRHEGNTARAMDRVVFWCMRHADLYLLSLLPPAVKDIGPDPARCVQFFNCIDGAQAAAAPPDRQAGDVLQLAYGKSRFHPALGISTVIAAAEDLKRRNISVLIHVVGRLTPEFDRDIRASSASDFFKIHGFIDEARGDFYRRIHVGLCPYEDYEDLRYIFPIKVLEHLSQGNPVIVSRLPALCAMVQDNENGLVVDPGDSVQLADAIARLATDRDLWARLAANALSSVARFDVRKKNHDMFHVVAERYLVQRRSDKQPQPSSATE